MTVDSSCLRDFLQCMGLIRVASQKKLNNVEPSINFTYEKESNNTVLFLDILIYIYIYIYICVCVCVLFT